MQCQNGHWVSSGATRCATCGSSIVTNSADSSSDWSNQGGSSGAWGGNSSISEIDEWGAPKSAGEARRLPRRLLFVGMGALVLLAAGALGIALITKGSQSAPGVASGPSTTALATNDAQPVDATESIDDGTTTLVVTFGLKIDCSKITPDSEYVGVPGSVLDVSVDGEPPSQANFDGGTPNVDENGTATCEFEARVADVPTDGAIYSLITDEGSVDVSGTELTEKCWAYYIAFK